MWSYALDLEQLIRQIIPERTIALFAEASRQRFIGRQEI